MNFAEAVTSVFKQYAVFSGRARRSEYWWFILFNLILGVVVLLIDTAMGSMVLGLIVDLALLLPGLAVSVRRLHDTGRTGWWMLIALIPIVGLIILIVYQCQDSDPGANEYGPSPKEIGSDPGAWNAGPATYGSPS